MTGFYEPVNPVDLERELRREWWLNHGCPFTALYGDDGEMQCGTCLHDFKREPMNDLYTHVQARRLHTGAQRLAALEQELAAQGLPADASVADLVRHHRGNAALTVGFDQVTAELVAAWSRQAADALTEAVAIIEGLAEQQAMSSDWYREALDRVRAVLKAAPEQ